MLKPIQDYHFFQSRKKGQKICINSFDDRMLSHDRWLWFFWGGRLRVPTRRCDLVVPVDWGWGRSNKQQIIKGGKDDNAGCPINANDIGKVKGQQLKLWVVTCRDFSVRLVHDKEMATRVCASGGRG